MLDKLRALELPGGGGAIQQQTRADAAARGIGPPRKRQQQAARANPKGRGRGRDQGRGQAPSLGPEEDDFDISEEDVHTSEYDISGPNLNNSRQLYLKARTHSNSHQFDAATIVDRGRVRTRPTCIQVQARSNIE